MTNEMWKEMSHKYIPKVDDYVVWEKENLEGWVYFVSRQYITIEFAVKDKPDDYVHFHKKVHCCVLCFPPQWEELKYIKNRREKVTHL